MEHVETISVAIVIITAVWKGIEGIINYRVQKKVKQAELRTATIQAENTMLQNWVQWSQTLEKRVKEAEETIISLKISLTGRKRSLPLWKDRTNAWSDAYHKLKDQDMKNSSKTEIAIAVLSGTFLLLSIVRVSLDLYRESKKKKCNCQEKKETSHAH